MPKWWPFTSKDDTQGKSAVQAEQDAFHTQEVALQQELAANIAQGMPRQAIMKAWQAQMAALEQTEQTPQVKGHLRAYDLLYGDLRAELGRNLNTGRALEMSGRVDEAVGYYETAVSDQMSTRFPYEHLRIIYRRHEQYNDALRICRAALKNPFLSEQDYAHFHSWAEKLAHQIEQSP